MIFGQSPQLRRQGKRDHKVITRHLFFQLILNPQLRFMMLAMRAVAMTAGVRNKRLMITVGTADLHNRTKCCPADFKRIQRFSLNQQNPPLIGVKEIRLKLINDRGK